MKENKNVLVTGGAGFIGTHVVKALLAKGYWVRALDSLTPPTHERVLPPWFPKEAEFVMGDVRNKEDWARALLGMDYVIHLAAYMDSHPDFSTYFSVNAVGTALLFETIRAQSLPIKKIVLASSQSVYGEGKYRCAVHGVVYPSPRTRAQFEKGAWDIVCPTCGSAMEVLPQNEQDELHALSAYGESKIALERIALTLGRELGIPTVPLRYSIVHGPHQSFRHYYSGALRAFTAMALSARLIEHHEDGLQLRDFVHVDDVAEAHICVLEDSRADWQVFNVGSGEPTRVIDLARRVCDAVGVLFQKEAKIFFRESTPRHSVMDISKLEKLGWRPQHTIDDNVRDYVRWIKEYPEAKTYFSRAHA